ncbi:hypothetical protein [Deinococcus hopiensis]|uniref:TIM21 protein n=1 Tax=Deinococcus hopiensis KR-140 TaxID=695939 RepID=A0A1W1UL45_9DEIO|nr:hypothetical protein [Deinococcus hopiensis]SMB81816.1 TIM21 protein [Deinococcus hopiensis KR-140]
MKAKRVFALLLILVACVLLTGAGNFALFAGLVLPSGDSDRFNEALGLCLLCLTGTGLALYGAAR